MNLLSGHCKEQCNTPIAYPIRIFIILFSLHRRPPSFGWIDPLIYNFSHFKMCLCRIVISYEIVKNHSEDFHHGQICVLEKCSEAHGLTVAAVGIGALERELVE